MYMHVQHASVFSSFPLLCFLWWHKLLLLLTPTSAMFAFILIISNKCNTTQAIESRIKASLWTVFIFTLSVTVQVRILLP